MSFNFPWPFDFSNIQIPNIQIPNLQIPHFDINQMANVHAVPALLAGIGGLNWGFVAANGGDVNKDLVHQFAEMVLPGAPNASNRINLVNTIYASIAAASAVTVAETTKSLTQPSTA